VPNEQFIRELALELLDPVNLKVEIFRALGIGVALRILASRRPCPAFGCDNSGPGCRSRFVQLAQISHKIHDHPELGFEEHFASELLCEWLESKGFQVHQGVFGLSTAFLVTKGYG